MRYGNRNRQLESLRKARTNQKLHRISETGVSPNASIKITRTLEGRKISYKLLIVPSFIYKYRCNKCKKEIEVYRRLRKCLCVCGGIYKLMNE